MTAASTTKPAKDRPTTFVITVRAQPRVDPIRALRALLKIALRRLGLKCISATAQEGTEGDQP
jgi:hypothetical protein